MSPSPGFADTERQYATTLGQLGPLLSAHLRRDWKIAISYRLAFVTQISQSVLTLGFLYFLGRLVSAQNLPIGKSASLHLGYFPFAVLGVSLLGVVNAELRTVSGQLRTDQMTGTLEAVLAMPPPPWLTVMSSLAYQLVYSTAAAGLSVLIAVVGFSGMHFHADIASATFAAAGLLISLPLFASLGVGFASAVVVFKRGGTVFGFVVTGFSLLGGVYYPTGVLSRPLHLLSDILPFTWALNVIRAGLLERRLLWGQFGLLLGASAVCVPLSLTLFTRAVARARRSGSLGQY
jgi:ABC-type multidrug transport system permease subunit